MIFSTLFICLLVGWFVPGSLSSPLLLLPEERGYGYGYDDGPTSTSMATPLRRRRRSMRLGGKRATRDVEDDVQGLDVEERDTIGITAAELDKFKTYAQWAGASYCNPVAETPVYCRGDICPAGENGTAMVYQVFSGTITDILAFLAISPATSELILSVRGTTSLTNWLDDVLWARAATSLCSGCEAHLGFLTAYSELVAAINASLVTALARYPSYRIVVTGHSLGGAVATLLALHLRDALRGLLLLLDPGRGGGIALYTYGSPRVGNRALAAYVTQQQSGTASGGNYRVTHAADGVPRVPPAIADYRHVAPEYWLTPGPDGRTVYDPRLVAVCKGYASGRCNAGTPWWEVDIPSHLYYLVAISRCGEGGGGEEEEEEEIGATLGFSAAGRLSFDGGGGGGREGGGGYQYNGGIMGNENGNGNGTGPLGPVNGTTATNSTNATVDGLLTPATTNTLAMYAKLDQEFMAALEETGPGGDVAKPVF